MGVLKNLSNAVYHHSAAKQENARPLLQRRDRHLCRGARRNGQDGRSNFPGAGRKTTRISGVSGVYNGNGLQGPRKRGVSEEAENNKGADLAVIGDELYGKLASLNEQM